MHDVRLAERYARALFATALKYDVVRPVEDDLTSIVGLLHGNAEFSGLLLNPSVSRDEKLRIVDKLFSDRVTAITMQAIRLILEKGREAEIPTIQHEFVKLRRKHERVLHVVITTSEVLEPALRDKVLDKLATATGKSVEPEFVVDPLLIGGIRVAYENFVLDGSLKGELRRLKDKLYRDVLKQN